MKKRVVSLASNRHPGTIRLQHRTIDLKNNFLKH